MALRDPMFRSLLALTASLLLVGTVVVNRVEGWSYLDSFYFSAISLATVGYGDFAPHGAGAGEPGPTEAPAAEGEHVS